MELTRTIAGMRFTFTGQDVAAAVADMLPEPIHDHYVVVDGRRYPPKQVVAALTGIDRADFTTHQARRMLRRAGFAVGRLSTTLPGPATRPGWPHGGREADALRPYRGQWVAQRGLDVLVAAATPQAVVGWLNQHGEGDATVFRVPFTANETNTTGLR